MEEVSKDMLCFVSSSIICFSHRKNAIDTMHYINILEYIHSFTLCRLSCWVCAGMEIFIYVFVYTNMRYGMCAIATMMERAQGAKNMDWSPQYLQRVIRFVRKTHICYNIYIYCYRALWHGIVFCGVAGGGKNSDGDVCACARPNRKYKQQRWNYNNENSLKKQ